ncbi:hypothetical protein M0R45_017130 [Rubus argutus]|uniref:Uncharacterized protein n=1 Tax=Rubus argutus TaxID=59490 RepID=A0AAW1XX44_RUBAR
MGLVQQRMVIVVAGFGRMPKIVMVCDKLPRSMPEREHGLEGESSSWASIWTGEAVMTASDSRARALIVAAGGLQVIGLWLC